MEELTLLKQPPLTDQVLKILIERIKDGVYPPGNKLPPENELISEFQISRATLRNAYAKLEERNLIRRRQGIGTFVNKQRTISNPLQEKIDFIERISLQGYSPGFKQLSAQVVTNVPEIAASLEVESNTPFLRIEKIWKADDQPIIYIVNHIPVSILEKSFSQAEITQPGFTEPLFQFFRLQVKMPIDHFASYLIPQIVEYCDLPENFSDYASNTPLMVIEDVGFTIEGIPIIHSRGHYFGPARKFETIRRVY